MSILPLLALLVGIAVLVWSAGRFVAGAAALAGHLGMAPLLIGMVVVGFGTSAPEMLVSGLAAWEGASGIALGNAYGSNIANIGLILGLTALLRPLTVHSMVLRRELPILLAVTLLTVALLANLSLSRLEGLILLLTFAALLGWSILEARRSPADELGQEMAHAAPERTMPLPSAALWTALGLLFLIASSRLLVWGASETARALGVSDLVIGLTVIAIGTSLPELASSLVAVRRGEHDIALGNVIGSNLFNTLTVVGIAATVGPMAVPAEVLARDLPVMGIFTLVLVLTCARFDRVPRVNRWEGAALAAGFLAYTAYLGVTAAAG